MSTENKIVVTGATGFIGTHLVERLHHEQYNVEVFDRATHNFNNVDSLKNLVRNSQIIFHLAASVKHDANSIDFNVQSTNNLLVAIRKVAPKSRIIFASTLAVFKTPKIGDVVNENFTKEPRNGYGIAKLKNEVQVREFANEGHTATILRLSNVYGPGIEPYKHSVVATFIDQIRKGTPITVNGDGSQTRDFIYVDDVVDALIKTSQLKGLEVPALNISSGHEVSIIELVRLVEKALNTKGNVEFRPTAPQEGGFWYVDNRLATETLNWKPKINLAEGLKLTINN